MDTGSFDALVRSFSRLISRRGLTGVLGVVALGNAERVVAGNRKRKRRKKRKNQLNNPLPPINQSPPPPGVIPNQFGCVNVGNFCVNSGDCCSGICQGSSCRAHDASTCQAGQSDLTCSGVNTNVECLAPNGNNGLCLTTTGNAGYCTGDRKCFACKRDTDCQAANICGPNGACVLCASCNDTGGTACAGPVPESCP